MCGQLPSGLTPLPPLRGERDFSQKYPAERGNRVLEGLGAKGPQPLQKTTPLPLRPRAVVAWRLHAGGGGANRQRSDPRMEGQMDALLGSDESRVARPSRGTAGSSRWTIPQDDLDSQPGPVPQRVA